MANRLAFTIRCGLITVLLALIPMRAVAYSYYVGESFYISLPSVNGIIDAAAWYCNEDEYHFDFYEDSYGCTIRVANYFTGERTIVCQYAYRTSSGKKSNGKTYYKVSCKPSTLSIDKKEITLKMGETAKLTYSNSSGFDPVFIVWETSDWHVADIDGDKRADNKKTVTIEGLKVGECVISCKGQTGGDIPTCKVTVVQNPASSISINPGSLQVAEGVEKKIYVSYQPANACPSYEWSSSDESVATVDRHGWVKGISEGSAVVTVTTDNGLSAGCQVEVLPQPKSISFNEDYNWTQGYYYHPLPEFQPNNAYRWLKWETDTPNVLKITNSGEIRAVRQGNAVITATTKNNLSASANVTVHEEEQHMEYRNVSSKVKRVNSFIEQIVIHIRN